MRLIITNDNRFGCNNGKTTKWFNSLAECSVFGAQQKEGWNESELAIAYRECLKNKHDVAEFGIYGGFMWSEDSEEKEGFDN